MDYYYEDYNYDNNYIDYDDEDVELFPWTFQTTLSECIIPSGKQILSYIGTLIGCCLVFRFVCSIAKHQQRYKVMHMVSLITGFVALFFTLGFQCLIVVFLCLISYTTMLIGQYFNWRSYGLKLTITTIASHILFELLWNKTDEWQRIRGLQMISAMKIISLAFDLKQNDKNEENISSIPGLIPFFGYIFNPATSALGPWISYSAYLRSIQFVHKGYRWLYWTVLNAVLAIAFLSLSDCLVPITLSHSSWKWMLTYRDALSVRCSQYFICFLSQATVAAAGIVPYNDGRPNSALGYLVCKPWEIEFPRSLTSVVRSWNLPMHKWLKIYMFRPMHNRYKNYLIAIIFTYIASSLLHGVHLKIYYVLFSLGFFAITENMLRLKLATIFNACVAANPCQKPCKYRNCYSYGWNSNTLIVAVINVIFSILTTVHLAYLGVMMSETNLEQRDNHFTNLLTKWHNLYFFSHWFYFANLLFYYII
ncbi:protein-serine O-palmitoleoyltransferase porcupine [Teleopsis dalmanni]|uniref:protein-serine O-palmitoleoyltransferase porcupine n=1 Tax=Teleopsis dalmanni TaxID=139649 RepID=UPI0018CFBDC0|nr:protein-serine O-palmitoleoyltransferase porcupine [Teleopsis dalmanni]